jgi:hypothetical protein
VIGKDVLLQWHFHSFTGRHIHLGAPGVRFFLGTREEALLAWTFPSGAGSGSGGGRRMFRRSGATAANRVARPL